MYQGGDNGRWKDLAPLKEREHSDVLLDEGLSGDSRELAIFYP